MEGEGEADREEESAEPRLIDYVKRIASRSNTLGTRATNAGPPFS